MPVPKKGYTDTVNAGINSLRWHNPNQVIQVEVRLPLSPKAPWLFFLSVALLWGLVNVFVERIFLQFKVCLL